MIDWGTNHAVEGKFRVDRAERTGITMPINVLSPSSGMQVDDRVYSFFCALFGRTV